MCEFIQRMHNIPKFVFGDHVIEFIFGKVFTNENME